MYPPNGVQYAPHLRQVFIHILAAIPGEVVELVRRGCVSYLNSGISLNEIKDGYSKQKMFYR